MTNTTPWRPHCLDTSGKTFVPCASSPIIGASVELPARFTEFKQIVLSTSTGTARMQLHEARWPNLNMSSAFPLLSYSGAWRNVSNGSVAGSIVSDDLAKTMVDWTGGRITAVFKTQYTFTRPIVSSEKNTVKYSPVPIGPGEGTNRLWGRFWLSGVAGALDSPGEWLFSEMNNSSITPMSNGGDNITENNFTTKGMLFYYPLEAQAGQNFDTGSGTSPLLLAKGLDYAFATGRGRSVGSANVMLRGFDLEGAALDLDKCDNCSVHDMTMDFPAFQPDIPEMSKNQNGSSSRSSRSTTTTSTSSRCSCR